MDKKELSKEAYNSAIEKGFSLENSDTPLNLQLAIGELDEALKHLRERGMQAWCYTQQWWSWVGDMASDSVSVADYNEHLAETVEIEIVDCYIRLLTIAGQYEIGLKSTPYSRISKHTTKRCLRFGEFCFYISKLIGHVATLDVDRGWVITPENLTAPLCAIEEYCDIAKINLAWFVDVKMRYNKTRPYQHKCGNSA